MKTRKIVLFSCAALVAAGIGLNIQNALANYGIGENSFSLVAVGDSNSNSNSNGNGGHGTNPSWTCPVWKVTYHFGTGNVGKDCESEGTIKCIPGKCPHGA